MAGKILHQEFPVVFAFRAVHAEPDQPDPHGVFLVFAVYLFRLDAVLGQRLPVHHRADIGECFDRYRIVRCGKSAEYDPVGFKADIAQNQEDYLRRYDEQVSRYEKAENELKTVQETIRMQNERSRRISEFINELEALPEIVTEFRIDYWGHLVDRVTVHSKDRITFTFTTGLEV